MGQVLLLVARPMVAPTAYIFEASALGAGLEVTTKMVIRATLFRLLPAAATDEHLYGAGACVQRRSIVTLQVAITSEAYAGTPALAAMIPVGFDLVPRAVVLIGKSLLTSCDVAAAECLRLV